MKKEIIDLIFPQPLPSIEEQNAFVEKYLAKMDEIAVLTLKLDKANDELKHLFDEEAE